jgi:hypothetical protein
MTSFWDAAFCNLVEISRRFRGANCLYHEVDDHSVSEAVIFKLAVI